MSTRKALDGSAESLEDDEAEHARLMKRQEKYEQESTQQMNNENNDEEYARMIKISEGLGRGDASMKDLCINDDDEEEEKRPGSNEGRLHTSDNDGEEEEIHSKQLQANPDFRGDSFVSPFSKKAGKDFSFVQKAQRIRNTQPSSKFVTPQRQNVVVPLNLHSNSSNSASFPSREELNEEFRQGIVQNVKVRVEQLQSKMKSKNDMFYVLRHMCKQPKVSFI